MSVKVAVRVRPFNERENGLNTQLCVKMNGPQTTIMDLDNEGGDNKPPERTFTFDYSFQSHNGFMVDENGAMQKDSPESDYADQAHVYDVLGKQVLDNAWQGYNCCLFAYGQTGAGKSYSMIGFDKNPGIVPMVMHEIFKKIDENTDKNNTYEVLFSMLEIYNEKVQDLLQHDKKQKPVGGLKIRQNQKGEVYVQDLTHHAVDSYERIAEKMAYGQECRSIGATQMNQTSSRAHTVITIKFKQIRQEGGRKLEKLSVINLVDLAGSEKAGQTGAQGQRLKEGCAINKSLTTLGTCISVLADKAGGKQLDTVVPYRDSSLTRILQQALGGNSKTIMICAISPAASNYAESLSTLRYADRAKKIVNKAVVNESVQDKMIRELKGENEQLKKALMEAAKNGKISIDLKALGLGDSEINTEDIQKQVEISEAQIQEMERTWEEKLKIQRQKDQEEREQIEKEQQQQQIKNKKVPHLTNLNEDPQLNGKLHYSLHNINSEKFRIGRQDADSKPQLVLRGAGVQQNHAFFDVDSKGRISINVNNKQAYEQTLVNGQQLKPTFDGQSIVEDSYKLQLNHLDRICIGSGTVFLFKYPLQNFVKQRIIQQVSTENQNLDPEEVEALIDLKIEQEGICQDPSSLACEQYDEKEIKNDDDAQNDCFEIAIEEAHQAEVQKQEALVQEQSRRFEIEKAMLEQQYKQKFFAMREAEEKKIQELAQQQMEVTQQLKQKEEMMNQIKIDTAREQEQQKQQFEQQAKDKVDASELDALQEELKRVREQIDFQKKVNETILKEQADQLITKMKSEQAVIERRRTLSIYKIQQEIDYSENARKVAEANEICKQIGSNIKFTQIFTKSYVNKESGRKKTYIGKVDEQHELQEELKIQVQNFDKGGSIQLWSEDQFEDRLVMMRDAQIALEQQQQLDGTYNKKDFETQQYQSSQFESEVFDDVFPLNDDFENSFLESVAKNVKTDNMAGQNFFEQKDPDFGKEQPQTTKNQKLIDFGEMEFNNEEEQKFQAYSQQDNIRRSATRKVPDSHLNVSKITEDIILETSYDRSDFQSETTMNTEQYLKMQEEQEAQKQINQLLNHNNNLMEVTNRKSFDIVEQEAQKKLAQIQKMNTMKSSSTNFDASCFGSNPLVNQIPSRSFVSPEKNAALQMAKQQTEVVKANVGGLENTLPMNQTIKIPEAKDAVLQKPQTNIPQHQPSQSSIPTGINKSQTVQLDKQKPKIVQTTLKPLEQEAVVPAHPLTKEERIAQLMERDRQKELQEQLKQREWQLKQQQAAALKKQKTMQEQYMKQQQSQGSGQKMQMQTNVQPMAQQQVRRETMPQPSGFQTQIPQGPITNNNLSLGDIQAMLNPSPPKAQVPEVKVSEQDQSIQLNLEDAPNTARFNNNVQNPEAAKQNMDTLRNSLRTGSQAMKMNQQQVQPNQVLDPRERQISFKDVQVEDRDTIVPINNQPIYTFLDFSGFEDVSKEEAKEADGIWTRELFAQSFQETITQEESGGSFGKVPRRLTIQHTGESRKSQPQYYIEGYQPSQKTSDIELKQAYLWNIMSHTTPMLVLGDLMLKPIPNGLGYIQCTIERQASGLNKLFPKYLLRLTNGNKDILRSQKIKNSATAHFQIQLTSAEAINNPNQADLGRLRANFGCTEFYIYDSGMKQREGNLNGKVIRKQYGSIIYGGSDQFRKKEGRSMDIYIPSISTDANKIAWWEEDDLLKKKNISKEYNHKAQQEQQTNGNIKNEITKFSSIAHDKMKLDFQGRISLPSKKNFQLVDEFDESIVYMQFGKAGEHKFNLDVAHPFSLYQAFAICLSTFDTKII